MSGNAFAKYRNVSINYLAPDSDLATPVMPIDAYKAVTKRVEETEFDYFNDPASVTDLTAATVLLTGTLVQKVYKFTVTSVKATGTYTFVYVGTYPNAAAANA